MTDTEKLVGEIKLCKTIDQLNRYRSVIVKETRTVDEFKLLQECFIKQKNKINYKKWIK